MVAVSGGRRVYTLCGICNGHNGNSKKKYYCASCMSNMLLKKRLETIETRWFNGKASSEVSQVFEDCRDYDDQKFLRAYLAGEVAGLRDDTVLEGLIPSRESVARLAYVLMTVNNAEKQQRLDELKKKIAEKRQTNDQLKMQLETTKNTVAERSKQLERDKGITKQPDSVQTKVDGLLSLIACQSKMLHNIRLDLVADLAKMMVSGSSEIMGSPVFSLDSILHYSMPLVVSSTEKLVRFVEIAAGYLDCSLPFDIEFDQGYLRVGGITLNSIVGTETSIVESLVELNQDQLMLFSTVISYVAADLLTLYMQLEGVTTNMNASDVLALDKIFHGVVQRMQALLTERDWHRVEVQRETVELLHSKRKWRNNRVIRKASKDNQLANPTRIITLTDPLIAQLLAIERVDLRSSSLALLGTELDSSIWSAQSLSGASVNEIFDSTDEFASRLHSFFMAGIARAMESYSLSNTTLSNNTLTTPDKYGDRSDNWEVIYS